VTNRHAAPGQAAGYLYQCEHALLDLIEGAIHNREVTVFLEKLDDIHLEEDDRPVNILQVKHHTGGGGSLTNESVDLWRTLDVWMDVLPRLEPEDDPEFSLVSTSSAPSGSAASLLRREDRDSDVALEVLRETAATSTVDRTADWRRRFARLDPIDQRRIVQAMVVRDAEPEILGLDAVLAGRLRTAVRPEHMAGFIESFKGWWYTRCVAMLRRTEIGVTTSDMLNKLYDLRDRYHPENLPFDYDLGDVTEEEKVSYATRLFIRQLELVAATNELLAIAVDEYHHAFANKSRWLRLGLIDPGELDEFEEKLVREWQRERAFMLAELGDHADPTEQERAGIALWRRVSDSQAVTIRRRFSDQNLTRGSYHELADRADQPGKRHVGWHPAFEERLRQVLGAAG
jgi:hypothetical protein